MEDTNWQEIPDDIEEEIIYLREKLGLSPEIYSDEQVLQLIKEVEKLSRVYISTFKKKKKNRN